MYIHIARINDVVAKCATVNGRTSANVAANVVESAETTIRARIRIAWIGNVG